MKWYWVKSYTPLAEVKYLIAYKTVYDNYRCAIAYWLDDNWWIGSSKLDEECTVTHFCNIDPIEIEE